MSKWHASANLLACRITRSFLRYHPLPLVPCFWRSRLLLPKRRRRPSDARGISCNSKPSKRPNVQIEFRPSIAIMVGLYFIQSLRSTVLFNHPVASSHVLIQWRFGRGCGRMSRICNCIRNSHNGHECSRRLVWQQPVEQKTNTERAQDERHGSDSRSWMKKRMDTIKRGFG
jgi:hypothetical protein